MPTIAELRKQAGLTVTELASQIGMDYNLVYSAEKYEGQDIKRNRAKYEAAQQQIRTWLSETAADAERSRLAGKLRRTVDGEEDLEKLYAEARQKLEDRIRNAPSGWRREVVWNGFKTGDRILIDGESEVFTFLCWTQTSRGHESVDCYGDRGDQRSFLPKKVLLSSDKAVSLPTTVVVELPSAAEDSQQPD